MKTRSFRWMFVLAATASLTWVLLEPIGGPATDTASPAVAERAPEPLAARAAPPRLPPPHPAPRREPSAPPPEEAAPADPETLFEGEVPLEELLGAEEAERQAAANARWRHAVEDGGYTAEQVDPAIVDFFEGIELVPVLNEEGLIEGLDVVALEQGSAADRSGFARGDRIVEIDGERLRDPADVPRLLVQLGPRTRLCAARGGRRICRRVGTS